jgi:hypothetical protein
MRDWSEKGRIVTKGLCPPEIRDINVAELYAAKIGIETAVREWSPVTGVQINSDNRIVCTSLYPWSDTHRNKDIRAIQDEIRKFLAGKNIRVRLSQSTPGRYVGTELVELPMRPACKASPTPGGT